MMGVEANKIFEAVKHDDLASFSSLIEKDNSLISLCFGRFPLLSVCYIFNSKKIIKKFCKELYGINNFTVVEEPFLIYCTYKKLAGKNIRLYANKQNLVMPIEVKSILHHDAFVRRHYKNFAKTENTQNNLKEIYRLNKQKCEINGEKIKISAKKLTKKQKFTLILSNSLFFGTAMIFFLVVGIIAGTIGLGTTFSPRKIYSAEQFLSIKDGDSKSYILENDIALETEFNRKNYSGVLFGNGKVLTINYSVENSLFDSLSGEINNLSINYTEQNISISKSLGILTRENNGAINDISISYKGNIDFANQDDDTYFSSIIKNNGEIKNVSVLIDVDAKSQSTKNTYVSALVSDNYGSLNECIVNNESKFENENVDVSGVAIQNHSGCEIQNCKNYADISQKISLDGWSPAVSGIVLNNMGTVSQCSNYGNITVDYTIESTSSCVIIAGGICSQSSSTIYKSKSVSNIVINSQNQTVYVGGICAYVNTNSQIINTLVEFCGFEGNIEINKSSDENFAICGGICGFMIGIIRNCYSLATFSNSYNKETRNATALLVGATYKSYNIWSTQYTIYISSQNNHCLTSDNTDESIALVTTNISPGYEFLNEMTFNVTVYETSAELKLNEVYTELVNI